MTAPSLDTWPWMNVAAAAARAERHPNTIRLALEYGDLHGHQRRHRGRWQIHTDALDAWVRGEPGVAACGCSQLTRRRRSA